MNEQWSEQDEERFYALVEKEALGRLAEGELEELDQLSEKRDRLIAKVPEEELKQERMRHITLRQLERRFTRPT